MGPSKLAQESLVHSTKKESQNHTILWFCEEMENEERKNEII